MSIPILLVLLAACAASLLIERSGARTTLQLSFKGDVKRETAFLAQWGQSVATPLVALLIWQLDKPRRPYTALIFVASVLVSSGTCLVLKRVFGRVRPNRENAGKFLGPSWRHANYRESFPSSHSACAMCSSIFLAHLYPAAAVTFWGLGITTAVLRWLLDAHWPSDVIAGLALGYVIAYVGLQFV